MVHILDKTQIKVASPSSLKYSHYTTSRLLVDEDDLEWMINENSYRYYSNSSMTIFENATSRCRKLSHSSELQNAPLMHRERLKGFESNLFILSHLISTYHYQYL